MNRFGIFLFFLTTTFASICLGDIRCVGETSCDIINDAAEASGLSLPGILGELDGKIVKPIEANVTRGISQNMGTIVYTPGGSEGGTKFSLAGSLVLGYTRISTSILQYPFAFGQYPGSVLPMIILETGGEGWEHIFNVGGTYGPADLGTHMLEYSTFQKSLKLSYGVRYHILPGNPSLSLLGGVSYGRSNMNVISSPGTSILISTQYGRVGWEGIEEYNHSLKVAGGNLSLIGGYRWRTLNFTLDIGTVPIYTWGYNSLSKTGTVGPFLGSSGFFSVGVVSSSPVSTFMLLPRTLFSLEGEVLPTYFAGVTYSPPLFDPFHRGSLTLSHTF